MNDFHQLHENTITAWKNHAIWHAMVWGTYDKLRDELPDSLKTSAHEVYYQIGDAYQELYKTIWNARTEAILSETGSNIPVWTVPFIEQIDQGGEIDARSLMMLLKPDPAKLKTAAEVMS